MGAFGTLTKQFSPLYAAARSASKSFVDFTNRSADKQMLFGGAYTIRLTTAVTLGTITDGTMPGNSAARTEVNLTVFHGTHSPSLFPWEPGQFDAQAMAQEIAAFADAMNYLAETTMIDDFIAGSPGQTVTLPAGQALFKTDGSLAQRNLAFDRLCASVAYVESGCQNKAGGIGILVANAAYRYVLNLASDKNFSADFDRQTYQVERPDGTGRVDNRTRWYFRGYPIFSTVYTAAGEFGAVSKECCFVFHTDAEAMMFNELYFPQDDNGAYLREYGDYMKKALMCGWGYAGLIQAGVHLAAVNCTTS